jgi:hypothetical protein
VTNYSLEPAHIVIRLAILLNTVKFIELVKKKEKAFFMGKEFTVTNERKLVVAVEHLL